VKREGEGLACAPLLHFAVQRAGNVGEVAMMVVEGKGVAKRGMPSLGLDASHQARPKVP
jgi:hypothetical protein